MFKNFTGQLIFFLKSTPVLPFWLLEHRSLKLNSLVKIDGECVDHRSMGLRVTGSTFFLLTLSIVSDLATIQFKFYLKSIHSIHITHCVNGRHFFLLATVANG